MISCQGSSSVLQGNIVHVEMSGRSNHGDTRYLKGHSTWNNPPTRLGWVGCVPPVSSLGHVVRWLKHLDFVSLDLPRRHTVKLFPELAPWVLSWPDGRNWTAWGKMRDSYPSEWLAQWQWISCRTPATIPGSYSAQRAQKLRHLCVCVFCPPWVGYSWGSSLCTCIIFTSNTPEGCFIWWFDAM